LKSELPDVFEKVDVHRWVYEAGLPDERHKPQSPLYEEVQQALDAYKQGIKPGREQLQHWQRYQVLSFLQGLPGQIPVEDCRYFDEVLDLEQRNDVALSSYFYATCIASGHQAILPRVEQFMGKIGRMLHILRIVRAMIATDWARGQIRPLFERVRDRHHQITIQAVEKLLKQAGL
jgi:hypothetical protein